MYLVIIFLSHRVSEDIAKNIKIVSEIPTNKKINFYFFHNQKVVSARA